MTQEEKDALLLEVKNQVIEAMKSEDSAKADAAKELETQFKALEDSLKEIKDADKTENIIKEIGDISAGLKAIKENGSAGPSKSFYGIVKEQLEANKEALIAMMKKTGDVNLVINKAPATITTGNVVPTTPGGIAILLNDPEAGITPIPRSQPFFLDLFTKTPTSGKTVSYAEMKNPDGDADPTAEGAIKNQIDFDYVETSETVRKITAFIKASKESLDDIDSLAADINNELRIKVGLKVDSQALTGDGTGQNLKGAIPFATTFDGGGLSGLIEAANNFDVLIAALTQIMIAEVEAGEPAGFMGNAIVMHPVDVAIMKLTKDLNNNYIFPITIPGTTSVMEVPVTSNARMTLGDFLVLDTSKFNVRMREEFNINVGFVDKDFTQNLITILGETRLVTYIKSNHTKAIVTGDFVVAKALLETV